MYLGYASANMEWLSLVSGIFGANRKSYCQCTFCPMLGEFPRNVALHISEDHSVSVVVVFSLLLIINQWCTTFINHGPRNMVLKLPQARTVQMLLLMTKDSIWTYRVLCILPSSVVCFHLKLMVCGTVSLKASPEGKQDSRVFLFTVAGQMTTNHGLDVDRWP